jgi:hypothetical protein
MIAVPSPLRLRLSSEALRFWCELVFAARVNASWIVPNGFARVPSPSASLPLSPSTYNPVSLKSKSGVAIVSLSLPQAANTNGSNNRATS